MTERVVSMLKNEEIPDFTFFYICWVDEAGHKYGWMTDEYLRSVKDSLDYVQRVAELLPEDCCLIVTADHGGHDRSHGKDFPEDMTIPVFIRQKGIAPGEIAKETSILDIAPTIVSLLGVSADPDWEGHPLL